MTRKIQLSLISFAVIGMMFWLFDNNQIDIPANVNSTDEIPSLDLVEVPVASTNLSYSDDVTEYLKDLNAKGISEDASDIEESVVTYTNREGQEIEIVVKTGEFIGSVMSAN